METYNYRDAMDNDIREYCRSEGCKFPDRETAEEILNQVLWTCDSVTGNASGSYTLNTWQAEENLCHNFHLLKDACDEFGQKIQDLEGPEAADVTIRCYLLPEVISDLLDDEDFLKTILEDETETEETEEVKDDENR